MTEKDYEFLPDLAAEATQLPRGIHSQTLSRGGGVELVLFSMATGEQLSEHTAARPAIVHVLSGEGELTVAGDRHPIKQGSWLRMPPRTAHAVFAHQPMVFALYLLPF